MIALAVLLQAAVPVPMLDTLGKQQLPAKGCAAYLWTDSDPHRLVAMASGDSATVKLSLGGKTMSLARSDSSGDAGFGFGSTIRYIGTDLVVRLDLTIATQPALSAGGTIPRATLTIDRPGQDTVIVPVAGLVGCASQP